MEPTESDSVEYYDKLHLGEDFVVQWDKHIKNNDKYRLKVQLRILLDGTFIFVYQHFTEEAKYIFETDKYPIMIGLKDGFSIPVEKDEKGSFSIYLKKIQSKKPHLGRGGSAKRLIMAPNYFFKIFFSSAFRYPSIYLS